MIEDNGGMPMLDPLATFLMRVLAAGNDADPVAALFSRPDEISDAQRAMAEELTRRGREEGHLAESGPGRVAVTERGRQFLTELDL